MRALAGIGIILVLPLFPPASAAEDCSKMQLQPDFGLVTSLQDAMVGHFYFNPVSASGGTPPYRYATEQPQLPPGIALSSSEGTLTGTPTTPGDYKFDITATDSLSCNVTNTYEIWVRATHCDVRILPGPEVFDSMPVNQEFFQRFTATGGSGSVTFKASGLPPGLSINSDGFVLGTPTEAGEFEASIIVTDSDGCQDHATALYSVTNPCDPPMVFLLEDEDGDVLRTGEVPNYFLRVGDDGYDAGMGRIEGGTPPYMITRTGDPPPGITPVTGQVADLPPFIRLDGTFTTEGKTAFTITITDANGCSIDVTFLFTVAAPRKSDLLRIRDLPVRPIPKR